jgi:hypothetical protein
MNNTLCHNLKNTFSKWLLAAVLLLSFFTFSGVVVQTQIKLDKPQTTLVVNANTRVIKSVNYNRLLVPARFERPLISAFIRISRFHSQLVKIQTTKLSEVCIPKQTALFYQPKITSKNADDHAAILLG